MGLRIVPRLDPPAGIPTILRSKAQKRMDEIEKEGIRALESVTRGRGLVITPDVVEAARQHVTPPQQAALESLSHIQHKVALRQYESIRPCVLDPTTGVKIVQEIRPVSSMAVVAPGTWDEQVPHVLSAELAAARVAGVPRRAVFLEPDAAGGVSPVSILAAGIGEATEIYRAGGVQALMALARGWMGFVPERTDLAGGNRLTHAAYAQLFGAPALPKYDLLVVTDSQSGVIPVMDILSTWLNDDPLSTVGFCTTSSRLVARMESHMNELSSPKPAWTRDLSQVPVVVSSTVDEALRQSAAYRVEYLVLLVARPEQYVPQIQHASHIVMGDNASAWISRRAFHAGVLGADAGNTLGNSGVYSYLRSVTVEKINHKAAERLRVHLNQICRT